jgi:hypothetical protein
MGCILQALVTKNNENLRIWKEKVKKSFTINAQLCLTLSVNSCVKVKVPGNRSEGSEGG